MYISEAHTVLWPRGCVHPQPQKDEADRLDRLSKFVLASGAPACPGLVWCADAWAEPSDYTFPNYENTLHAWPDHFILLNESKTIIETNVFGTGAADATVLNDYVGILSRLVGSK